MKGKKKGGNPFGQSAGQLQMWKHLRRCSGRRAGDTSIHKAKRCTVALPLVSPHADKINDEHASARARHAPGGRFE